MLVTFQDTNWKFEAFGYRGGGDVPIIEPEGVQSITAPFHIYSKTSHCNLFVPPAFYLHSGFRFDPKVIMERMQGPHPLGDVQATVIVWSAYSTSRAQAGVFTSAFTRVAQEFEGSASHYEMLQEISRRVGEATGGEGGHPLLQIWTHCDGENKEMADSMNDSFVI